ASSGSWGSGGDDDNEHRTNERARIPRTADSRRAGRNHRLRGRLPGDRHSSSVPRQGPERGGAEQASGISANGVEQGRCVFDATSRRAGAIRVWKHKEPNGVMSRARTRQETRLKETDFPLVRGGKIPKGALRWLAEVERVSPASRRTSSWFETPALLHCARRRWEEAQSRKMVKQNERSTKTAT